MTNWQASDDRYSARDDGWFRQSGRWGLKLPAISLGMWHNFGAAGSDSQRNSEADIHANARAMMHTAFDLGVTHFDLANNYGPPPGAAEDRVGRILSSDFACHRDDLVISTKAGYDMLDGPYQDGGSRKYLLDSCAASLRRLQLDYVDIFYHHRPDPEVPLEETMGALNHLVQTGQALYVGLSNYGAERLAEAMDICERMGFAKPIIHQHRYNLLDTGFADSILPTGHDRGMGAIVFCPLAQGLLTDKYLESVPNDSRASTDSIFFGTDAITPAVQKRLQALNEIAAGRGQSLAQLALSWVLADKRITSALIGASRPSQIVDCCAVLSAPELTAAETAAIEAT